MAMDNFKYILVSNRLRPSKIRDFKLVLRCIFVIQLFLWKTVSQRVELNTKSPYFYFFFNLHYLGYLVHISNASLGETVSHNNLCILCNQIKFHT